MSEEVNNSIHLFYGKGAISPHIYIIIHSSIASAIDYRIALAGKTQIKYENRAQQPIKGATNNNFTQFVRVEPTVSPRILRYI